MNEFINILRLSTREQANFLLEEKCGVVDFLEENETIDDYFVAETKQINIDEFGDWQTNATLSEHVCQLIQKRYSPEVIIEPTCGKGSFILSALRVFPAVQLIIGIEIHKPYLIQLKRHLLEQALSGFTSSTKIYLLHADFFHFDFSTISGLYKGKKTLVLGNPPWVTNSKLGSIDGNNLPTKHNYKSAKGISAITGKGNFDIAEYICKLLIDNLGETGNHLSLLIKNSVIKNIVSGIHTQYKGIADINQYNFDAKKEFDVSVAASLLDISFGRPQTQICHVFDLFTKQHVLDYGWVNNHFVSNIEAYQKRKEFDGECTLDWWSGIKHDCSKIMELTKDADGTLRNGLNEAVHIENDLIFPLAKSSDIQENSNHRPLKYVIVTQNTPSEDTAYIKEKYPLTYEYLLAHASFLDARKSIIYSDRPRFCIFGIGDYSFKPYKVAISALYKQTHFTVLKPIDGKPIMLDDTCYLCGFDYLEDAETFAKVLNSSAVQEFISSLVFTDAKRVISKDILNRLDIESIFSHMSTSAPKPQLLRSVHKQLSFDFAIA